MYDELYSDAIIGMADEWLFQNTGQQNEFLLRKIHEEEFVPFLEQDNNRVSDVIDFRRRFGYYDTFTPPSMLELMLSLACRCEEDIMGEVGSFNPGRWFAIMMSSLGLLSLKYETDERLIEMGVKRIMSKFRCNAYSPDGDGGLFYMPGIEKDIREVEIWFQLQLYLKWRNYDFW